MIVQKGAPPLCFAAFNLNGLQLPFQSFSPKALSSLLIRALLGGRLPPFVDYIVSHP